jgi:N-acylneuraminate cytidylyltransferase
MEDIIAIIPARGGSKGVPGKNIKLLGGYPLIAYSIIAARLSQKIRRTIISTDSKEIAAIGKKYGAEVPFLRPAEISGDRSADIEFVLHAINWFNQNEGGAAKYYVHLRPTTPLREPKVVDQAIEEIERDPTATALRSGHPAPESPFKWFRRDAKGYFKGIIAEASNDTLNQPRQAFPEVYIPDGYVDVLKTEFIQKSGQLHGDKMIGFISPACVEVDSAEDFEFLEYELNIKKRVIADYLKQNFAEGI